MLGIYFSGTGNSRYALEVFLREYNDSAEMFSIEDNRVIEQIEKHDEIIFSYPVQYSNIPLFLRQFVIMNQKRWKEKRIFIIATMGIFSGDGAGVLGRLLHKYGAEITGGLHLKMPDNVCDVKALKRTKDKNIKLVKKAEMKIHITVHKIKSGNPPQEGMGVFCQMAGLFGQRLYFAKKTSVYTDRLRIDTSKCIGCGKCVELCPMQNITLVDDKAVSGNQCTMCYRCANRCSEQAITLLGKKVVSQSVIEKYIS